MKVTSMTRYSRTSRKIIFTGEEKEIRRNAKKLRTFLRNCLPLMWEVVGPFALNEDKSDTVYLLITYPPKGDERVKEAINKKGKELGFQI